MLHFSEQVQVQLKSDQMLEIVIILHYIFKGQEVTPTSNQSKMRQEIK